jgi:hypothetical protein
LSLGPDRQRADDPGISLAVLSVATVVARPRNAASGRRLHRAGHSFAIFMIDAKPLGVAARSMP